MTLAKIEYLLDEYIDPRFFEENSGALEDMDQDEIANWAYEEYYSGWRGWHERESPGSTHYVPNLGYVVAEYVRDYDDAALIFKVYQNQDLSDTPEIYRKNGWYSSYQGATFEGSFEKVKAVQKTVTYYESVE